eukprot:TRINITY_DN32116_c0_g1_i1.p1 TRINITY_DN32116_c0_g1~~TRINITY_DN32116_c0_g1_i1.p1  ORF type:complete len:210 (-),score=29.05 TRINITY_DN32116_c0_g1_i1:101-661(-)
MDTPPLGHEVPLPAFLDAAVDATSAGPEGQPSNPADGQSSDDQVHDEEDSLQAEEAASNADAASSRQADDTKVDASGASRPRQQVWQVVEGQPQEMEMFLQEVAGYLLGQPFQSATTCDIGDFLSQDWKQWLRSHGLRLSTILRCFAQSFAVTKHRRKHYVVRYLHDTRLQSHSYMHRKVSPVIHR